VPGNIKSIWVTSCFAIFFGFLYFSFQAQVKEVRAKAEEARIQKLKESERLAQERNSVAQQIKQVAELTSKGNFSESIPLARSIIEKNPQAGEAYLWLGIALVKSGQKEEALQQFIKASEINPKNPESYVYWGLTLVMLGNNEEAVQKLETAINLDQKNSNAFVYLGTALGHLGKYEESINKLEQSLTLDNANILAYEALVEVYYDRGKYEKAWEMVFRSRNLNLAISSEALKKLSLKMPEPKQ
jgi:tetratricopeptide (TPR) repeat protein